jgi:hypothetical protein
MPENKPGRLSLKDMAQTLKQNVEQRSTQKEQDKLNHFEGMLRYLQGVEEALSVEDVSSKTIKLWVKSTERVLGGKLSKEVGGDIDIQDLLKNIADKEKDMVEAWETVQQVAKASEMSVDDLLKDEEIPGVAEIKQARAEMEIEIAEAKEKMRQYGLGLVEKLRGNVGVEQALSEDELAEWKEKFAPIEHVKPKEHSEAMADMKDSYIHGGEKRQRQLAIIKEDREKIAKTEAQFPDEEKRAGRGSSGRVRYDYRNDNLSVQEAKEIIANKQEELDSLETEMAVVDTVSAEYIDNVEKILDNAKPKLDDKTKLRVMEMIISENLDFKALKMKEYSNEAIDVSVSTDLNETLDAETIKKILVESLKSSLVQSVGTNKEGNVDRFNKYFGVMYNLDKGGAKQGSDHIKQPLKMDDGSLKLSWRAVDEPREPDRDWTKTEVEDKKYQKLNLAYKEKLKEYKAEVEKFYEFASQDVDLLNRVETVCKLYYERLSSKKRSKLTNNDDGDGQTDTRGMYYRSISPVQESGGNFRTSYKIAEHMGVRTTTDGTIFRPEDAKDADAIEQAKQKKQQFIQEISRALTSIKGEKVVLTNRDAVVVGNEQIVGAQNEALHHKGKVDELSQENRKLIADIAEKETMVSQLEGGLQDVKISREAIMSSRDQLTNKTEQLQSRLGTTEEERDVLKIESKDRANQILELRRILVAAKLKLEQASLKPGFAGGNLKKAVAELIDSMPGE